MSRVSRLLPLVAVAVGGASADLLNRVRAELSPVGPIEELLADRVVNIMWRLGRSELAETALFDWRVRELRVSRLADPRGRQLPDPNYGQSRAYEGEGDACAG
jgi:hypothetical protein